MLVGLSTVGLYIYLGLYLVIKPLFMSFDREVETSLSPAGQQQYMLT